MLVAFLFLYLNSQMLPKTFLLKIFCAMQATFKRYVRIFAFLSNVRCSLGNNTCSNQRQLLFLLAFCLYMYLKFLT